MTPRVARHADNPGLTYEAPLAQGESQFLLAYLSAISRYRALHHHIKQTYWSSTFNTLSPSHSALS
jgi:hypothetical protein